MIRKQKSIAKKNEIKELLKSLKKTSKLMLEIKRSICCSCGDVIRLFTFDRRIISPSHTNGDLTEICDECFYNQNVIKDDDILIYYNEADIECEKNHRGYSYYVFNYNDVSKLLFHTNNMVYVNFWIGV